MHPTLTAGEHWSVVPVGVLKETLTSPGTTPSEIAAVAAHVLIDQCGSASCSTGFAWLQSGLVRIWFTAATRAPCRAAFAIVLYAKTARPRSRTPKNSTAMMGNTSEN